ncbi:MAG: hypothetical protein NTW06_02445 [Candidatus Falkowbacteria bacterium]|nr:hypothetical protein [Candidatus Falkowbacteria bacterium]
MVAASYTSTKLPLVSKDFQRKVDYLVASVPNIPKTPKQILIKAFEDSQKIKSARQDFKFSFGNDDLSLVSLEINSKVDINDIDNVALEAIVKGEVFTGVERQNINLSLVEIGRDLYFKLDNIPEIPQYNLKALKGNWYKLDVEQAQNTLGTELRADEKIKDDVQEKLEEVFNFLDENKLMEKIIKLPDDKLAEGESYHLQLPIDTATFVEIFNKYYPEANVTEKEAAEVIKDIDIDLWIHKKSFFIDKFELNFVFTDQEGSLQVGFGSKPVELTASYELSEINREMNIEAPKNAKELEGIMDLMMIVQPTSLSPVEEVLGISMGGSEFGSNVLFLERAIHVITLFPSAI